MLHFEINRAVVLLYGHVPRKARAHAAAVSIRARETAVTKQAVRVRTFEGSKTCETPFKQVSQDVITSSTAWFLISFKSRLLGRPP